MNNTLKLALLSSGLALLSLPASAQNTVKICVTGTTANAFGNSCVPVDANNPLPTTGSGGSGGGTSAVTISPYLSTIATATAIPTASKAGAAFSQPVFDSALGGGSQVGIATGLPIQGTSAANARPIPITATALPVNITQVYGASFATGIPVYATSLAVTSGSVDNTAKAGIQYSPVAGVAETSPTTGTNGDVNYLSMDVVSRGLRIDPVPVTAGGLSISSQTVPANNTALAIDASPGQIYKIEAYNNNATILYLNYFNASQAVTDCKSPATAIYRVMVPANSTSGAGVVTQDLFGLPFSTAITQCAGTVFGGTGLPTADEYEVNVFYK